MPTLLPLHRPRPAYLRTHRGGRAAALVPLALALTLPPAAAARPAGPFAVAGVVRIAVEPGGALPAPRRILNTTDPDVCGREHDLGDLVVAPDGGLANALVSVLDPPTDDPTPSASRTVTLDNRDCRFVPHALVLAAGDRLELRNADATLHTVHWYGPTQENVALPLQGVAVDRPLTEPGIYQIRCDVHGWMEAVLRVDRHRYHAVTAPDGRFRIEGLPPGGYLLEIWHERLGFLRASADVGPGERSDVLFTYPIGAGSAPASATSSGEKP